MKLSTIPNKDGRLECFTLDTSTGKLKHRWQKSPNGAWNDTGWQNFGTIQTGQDLATARNADGRVEVYVIAANGDVWHRYQKSPNGDWGDWSSMGGH